mmetsp:Transcript_47215/g.119535  ORF Transcript_47215/g.119535 Transcript_47215/m.119535 type:complete len:213 (-) Transcript_47215:67-705(-)
MHRRRRRPCRCQSRLLSGRLLLCADGGLETGSGRWRLLPERWRRHRGARCGTGRGGRGRAQGGCGPCPTSAVQALRERLEQKIWQVWTRAGRWHRTFWERVQGGSTAAVGKRGVLKDASRKAEGGREDGKGGSRARAAPARRGWICWRRSGRSWRRRPCPRARPPRSQSRGHWQSRQLEMKVWHCCWNPPLERIQVHRWGGNFGPGEGCIVE